MKNEAHARIKINKLLEEAGWRFFDDEKGKANILLENHVKLTQQEVDAWGNDLKKTKSGSLDFLLVDSNNGAAKRSSFPRVLALMPCRVETVKPAGGESKLLLGIAHARFSSTLG